MAAQTKRKLDALISDGQIQHIYGLVGCCKNYFVQFPNDTQKYLYNPNKPITAKLINKISNYVYTNTVMSSSSSGNPAESQPQVAGKRLTKKTNPSATTYEQPQGKRLTKKTKPSETNYGNIHHKSVNKIIHMLGRTIKMKITKSTNSLKKNTHNRCQPHLRRKKSICPHRSTFRQIIYTSKNANQTQQLQNLYIHAIP